MSTQASDAGPRPRAPTKITHTLPTRTHTPARLRCATGPTPSAAGRRPTTPGWSRCAGSTPPAHAAAAPGRAGEVGAGAAAAVRWQAGGAAGSRHLGWRLPGPQPRSPSSPAHPRPHPPHPCPSCQRRRRRRARTWNTSSSCRSKRCSLEVMLRRSHSATVLSAEPVATTYSLKGLKARQLTSAAVVVGGWVGGGGGKAGGR